MRVGCGWERAVSGEWGWGSWGEVEGRLRGGVVRELRGGGRIIEMDEHAISKWGYLRLKGTQEGDKGRFERGTGGLRGTQRGG